MKCIAEKDIKDCCCQDIRCIDCGYEDCHEGCEEFDKSGDCSKCKYSEDTEVCGWCSNSKCRIEFNLIDDDGNTITTDDDHMVIGGIADYCPMCGRKLNT